MGNKIQRTILTSESSEFLTWIKFNRDHAAQSQQKTLIYVKRCHWRKLLGWTT